MITPFELAVVNAVKQLRDALRAANLGGDFHFEISASGRVQGGDTRIEYSLGQLYSTDGQVKGGSVAPVLAEYLRRKGWVAVHAPLMLPAATDSELSTAEADGFSRVEPVDEEPF